MLLCCYAIFYYILFFGFEGGVRFCFWRGDEDFMCFVATLNYCRLAFVAWGVYPSNRNVKLYVVDFDRA